MLAVRTYGFFRVVWKTVSSFWSLVWWSRTEIVLFVFAFFSFSLIRVPYIVLILSCGISPLTFADKTISVSGKQYDIARIISILKIIVSAMFFSAIGQLAMVYSFVWGSVLAVIWAVSAIVVSKVSIGPVSKRLANRIRAKKAITAWKDIWVAIKLDPKAIKARSAKETATGYVYTFRTVGYSYKDVVKHRERIASLYAASMGGQHNISTSDVRIYEGDRADIVKISIRVSDPLASIAPIKNISIQQRFDKPFPIGIDAHHNEVMFSVEEAHAAVFGMTGSGKSGALHILTGVAAHDPDCILYLADPKGGIELGGWKRKADFFAVEHDEIVKMLDTALEAMRQRQSEMERIGCRNAWKGQKKWKTHVIIIDEVPQLIQDTAPEAIREKVRHQLQVLTQLGRAAKFVVVVAAQRPTADQIPAAITNNMEAKIVLRLEKKEVEQAALGRRIEEGPATIPPGHRGRCFVRCPKTQLTEARIYHLPDADLFKWQELGESKQEDESQTQQSNRPENIIAVDAHSKAKDSRHLKVWSLILSNPMTVKELTNRYSAEYTDNPLTDTQIKRVIDKLISIGMVGVTRETTNMKQNKKYIGLTNPET